MAGSKPHALQVTCANCGLQRICFPRGLTQQEIIRLDAILQSQPVVGKGEALFKQGEAAKAIFALKSGVVKLCRYDRSGNEIIHTFYLPGDVIGLEALDQPVYQYDAIALDRCNLCRVEVADLDRLAQQMPNLNRQVLQMMRRELELERAHFENVSSRSADQRLAHFVWHIAERFRDRGYAMDTFQLPILHRDIATHLGLTPETVSRILRKFHQQGILTWQRKQVTLHDPCAVRELAGVEAPDEAGEGEVCPVCQAHVG